MSDKNNTETNLPYHSYHLNKPANANQCQEIYWNLLHYSQNNTNSLPTHFIRELEQTKRCDKFHDLKDLRKSYKSHLGKEIYNKIVKQQQRRDKDLEFLACQTLIHYSQWTVKRLVNSLSFNSKLYYYTVGKTERFFKTISASSVLNYYNNENKSFYLGPGKVIENYIRL
ncbi:hypothetical protein ABK040_011287 [Willaertia magna]